jgi:hypothetical protein
MKRGNLDSVKRKEEESQTEKRLRRGTSDSVEESLTL